MDSPSRNSDVSGSRRNGVKRCFENKSFSFLSDENIYFPEQWDIFIDEESIVNDSKTSLSIRKWANFAYIFYPRREKYIFARFERSCFSSFRARKYLQKRSHCLFLSMSRACFSVISIKKDVSLDVWNRRLILALHALQILLDLLILEESVDFIPRHGRELLDLFRGQEKVDTISDRELSWRSIEDSHWTIISRDVDMSSLRIIDDVGDLRVVGGSKKSVVMLMMTSRLLEAVGEVVHKFIWLRKYGCFHGARVSSLQEHLVIEKLRIKDSV